MSSFSEYDQYDGLGLAELIRKKEITPTEVCTEAIKRAEKINPQLNAIVHPLYDLAKDLASKELSPGPFYGVPFLLKDLLCGLKGVPLTFGSKSMQHFIPDHDTELVKRYKASGVVIMGKTNTPEFGLMGITEPELFGPCRNPWNPAHTPGGSSGGSAAAVAARIVPLASGGDGGGSIRIPASCCGLFGLKPSRGRVPTGPDWGEIWEGAVVEHVLSITVRDSAAMLDQIQGPDPGTPYLIPAPSRPFLQEVEQDPQKLKIGMCTASPLGKEVHPECVQAVKETACLLEDLGHIVEEVPLPYDGELVAMSYLIMYLGQVPAQLDQVGLLLGRPVKRREVEMATWTAAQIGQGLKAKDYIQTIQRWNEVCRAMGRFHLQYDLLLTPTLAHPPVKVGALMPNIFERGAMRIINALGPVARFMGVKSALIKTGLKNLEKMPYTQAANMTGQPAMSVPLYWSKDNLPCGVQFMAQLGEEAMLFRLAGQLERGRPWKDKQPPLCTP